MLCCKSPIVFVRDRTKADFRRAEKGFCFLCLHYYSLPFSELQSVGDRSFSENDKLLFNYFRIRTLLSLSLCPLLFISDRSGKLIILSGAIIYIIRISGWRFKFRKQVSFFSLLIVFLSPFSNAIDRQQYTCSTIST